MSLSPKIDILVSKLLGFETFAKSLRVSDSVLENLVSEKKSRFRFRKKLVSEKSLGFGKFGLGKEKIQITRTVLVMMSQIWDLVPIGTKALKWSHISPNSARKSQISSLWQDAKLSPSKPSKPAWGQLVLLVFFNIIIMQLLSQVFLLRGWRRPAPMAIHP